jgi:hypothetical protein
MNHFVDRDVQIRLNAWWTWEWVAILASRLLSTCEVGAFLRIAARPESFAAGDSGLQSGARLALVFDKVNSEEFSPVETAWPD